MLIILSVKVQGYMPAYELYLDGLRKGFFKTLSHNPSSTNDFGYEKTHLHVTLDTSRKIVDIDRI